jgi:hypothetical protein
MDNPDIDSLWDLPSDVDMVKRGGREKRSVKSP